MKDVIEPIGHFLLDALLYKVANAFYGPPGRPANSSRITSARVSFGILSAITCATLLT
ncbi:MAG: hypothetical protein AAFP87_09935 [Pseudomonadota bacterium]